MTTEFQKVSFFLDLDIISLRENGIMPIREQKWKVHRKDQDFFLFLKQDRFGISKNKLHQMIFANVWVFEKHEMCFAPCALPLNTPTCISGRNFIHMLYSWEVNSSKSQLCQNYLISKLPFQVVPPKKLLKAYFLENLVKGIKRSIFPGQT